MQSGMQYARASEIATNDFQWRFKYELIKDAKVQLREQAYFSNKKLQHPDMPESLGNLII